MQNSTLIKIAGFISKFNCAVMLCLTACGPTLAPQHRQSNLSEPERQPPTITDNGVTFGGGSQAGERQSESDSHVSEFVSHPSAPISALEELMAFQDAVRNGTHHSEEQLSQKMSELIHQIDSLAVKENTAQVRYILTTLESAQRGAILNAQLVPESSKKGLWLKWNERLFLTRDALRHYFSEVLLNRFERAIDLNQPQDTQSYYLQLKPVLHRDHERRVISILRGLDEKSGSYSHAIELLSHSGGPLSRLYFYQKLITEPSKHFADALAKVGLPRISDLIGKSSQVSDRNFLSPREGQSTTERFVADSIQDFKAQWSEFKRYFEELKQIPVKQQNARVKWSKLHEEIDYTISLVSAEPADKQRLRRELLQTFRSTASPWEHAYRHDGIEFREGDIILLQTGPVGGLWETLTQSGSLLSHLMMVHFGDDGIPMTVEMNYGQLLVAPLDLYSDRYTVIRPTGLTLHDRKAIFRAISELIESNLRYDFKFSLKTADQLYCSELVAAVFEKAGVKRDLQTFEPLSPQAASVFSAAGIQAREFYTQGSYIAGLGFSSHAERLNSDPRDYIRGLLVLDGFSKFLSQATSVKLSRHPEAHQLFALATLAQTVTPGVRRALGPPKFLYTALLLDKLINIIEEDARRAQVREPSSSLPETSSRIVELKRVINRSLEKALPTYLSEIFPQDEHASSLLAR